MDWSLTDMNHTDHYHIYTVKVETIEPSPSPGDPVTIYEEPMESIHIPAFEVTELAFEPGVTYLFAVTPIDEYGFENPTVNVWESFIPRAIE